MEYPAWIVDLAKQERNYTDTNGKTTIIITYSCMFCNVYDAKGIKIQWENESIEDYLKNRKNEKIMWQKRASEPPLQN